ncbi:MAG TPA: hypothetical protein VGO93_22635 [Candidatus Xenobia bacterium]|jgi:hypothetical protein
MNKSGFSWGWTGLAFAVFTVVEIVVGTLLHGLIASRFPSMDLDLKLSMLILVASFLVGGFVVALVSPRVRIWEAGVAAFLTVLMTHLYAFFVPVSFIHPDLHRMLVGGVMGLVLAAIGADSGERVSARLGNRKAQEWVDATR